MVWFLRKLKKHFLVIFAFFPFSAGILKLCSFCGLSWQNVTSYEKFCLFLPLLKLNSAFSKGTTHPERSKEEQNFKHGPKFTKREKITQNSHLVFSEKLGHVSVHLICQTKSPMLTDKWLKGFQNILNYAGDIGCQSCVTNFGTPCRFDSLIAEVVVKVPEPFFCDQLLPFSASSLFLTAW